MVLRRSVSPRARWSAAGRQALQSEVARLRGAVTELEALVVSLRGQLAAAQIEARSALLDRESEASGAHEERMRFLQRLAEQESELRLALDRLKEVDTELTAIREERAGLVEHQAEQESELRQAQGRLQAAHAEAAQLRAQITKTQHALLDTEAEVSAIREERTEIERVLQEKQHLLHQIYTSRGFRAVARWWELRRTWRDGPTAFSKHILRLGFRQLPLSIQSRIKALYVRGRENSGKPMSPGLSVIPETAVETDTSPRYGVGISGLVSVVLPVFNQAGLLRDATRSVLNQTYRAFELIVVDDGSTDAIREFLDELAEDPRVRVVVHEQNQGLPQALNSGFRYARGEFWTWTSADNLMMPEQLGTHVAFLQEHPQVAMVYSDYLAVDDRGNPLQDSAFRPHNRRTPDSPEIRLPRSTDRLNSVKDNFIGPCFMYRAWVGRLLGPYDAGLNGAEDYDYWMRINNQLSITHLGTDDLLYQYRVHDNSMNARAQDLGIFNRVERLMALDEARRRFCTEPFVARADAVMADRLRAALDHTVDLRAESTGGKELVFLSDRSNAVEWLRGLAAPHRGFVTVWLSNNAVRAYEIDRRDFSKIDLLFVESAEAIRRVAEFDIPTFWIRDGREAAKLARLAANDALFRRKQGASTTRAGSRLYLSTGRRLKVMLLVENFDKGGLEHVVYTLARELRDRACDPVIVVSGRAGSLADRAESDGLEIVRAAKTGRDHSDGAIIAAIRPDLINAHSDWADLQKAQGRPFAPVIQTLHNTYVWFAPNDVDRCREFDGITGAYVCVSDTVKKYADLRLKLDPARMRVIPNGIDLSRFSLGAAEAARTRDRYRARYRFEPNDFVLLCSSAFYRHKAQLETVMALRSVLSETPNAKLLFLGERVDLKYFDDVVRAIKDHKLTDHVVLVDFQSDPLGSYYAADAFILPSYWEGWSLSLAEAIAARLPVVATDVGAARQLASEGALIFLVHPPFDDICEVGWENWSTVLGRGQSEGGPFVRDLAAAMTACAHRPWTAPDLLRSREVIAQNYSVRRMADDYWTAYLDIWGRRDSLSAP